MPGRGSPVMNVSSEPGTTEPSHELGNASNFCYTCILRQCF
jgi:hypothetical protein